MRGVLLPFPGDPFLINYWLNLYDTVWAGEVDKLYILHNSSVEAEVENYIKDRVKRSRGTEYIYIPQQIEHGDAMERLLKASKEDYIMFIEDDAFIFRTGQVDTCFDYVEEGFVDAVVGLRGSCSTEIMDRAKELWNLDYSGRGDTGPNFWPCFFFSHRDIFKGTDYDFGAKAWERGEKIEALDHTVQDDVVAADTFVHMSLQLRAKGLKFYVEPHYHGSPYDVEHYVKKQYLFDGKAPWTHVGSLSSGVGGMLLDHNNYALANKNAGERDIMTQKPTTKTEKQEWERRVQWWLTFYENREDGKIEDFANEYLSAIQKLMGGFELSPSEIRRRQKVYRTLGL